MNSKYKIAIIIVLSVAFGIGQVAIQSIIISALMPIAFTLIISCLIELAKSIFKKGYRFDKFRETTWTVFIFIILLCFFSLLGQMHIKKEGEKSASNSETYKATVQKNNPKPVKEVGKVDTEFLNSDNLYENYSHNYSITFPTNFKVNYGIGQYSEVQAYDKDLAYTIIVNVAKSDVSKFFNSSQTIDEISEIMVKGVLEEFRSRKGVDKMERSLTEKGLSDVVLLSANLTNFHNRYFIDSRYSANVIIDNEKFPVIMTDYVTFYNNNVYHFFFRSWKDLHNAAWKNQIKTTMATVLINKAITNNYTNP